MAVPLIAIARIGASLLGEDKDDVPDYAKTGAKVFDDLLARGVRAGEIPSREKDARNWYRSQAKSTRIQPQALIKSDRDRLTSRPLVGRMYHFFYDAKHKQTLPYYDRFPLVFPMKKVRGGFLGLNMHYISLPARAKLMDALYNVASDRRYNEETKLKISYNILNSSARFRYFKPCVKHYLTPHVKSRYFEIFSTEWDIALFLPTERFVGSSKKQVHRESARAF